jgi:hypothetical protein
MADRCNSADGLRGFAANPSYVLGLLLLIGLDEVSKLHVDQYVVSPKAPN